MKHITITFLLAIAFTVVLSDDKHEHDDHHDEPHYKFAYGVHDDHSKDKKSQHEHRDGDKVDGYYTVHEPDGTKLVVEYTADKHKGFQATVHREGHAHHPDKHGEHHHGGHGGDSFVKTTHWGHGSGR